jgi:hypothetical protein
MRRASPLLRRGYMIAAITEVVRAASAPIPAIEAVRRCGLKQMANKAQGQAWPTAR